MQSEDTRNVVGICRAAAEAMISERIQWRLDPKYILALCDTVAALSDKQAGEVKIKPLEWRAEPPYRVARPFTGLHYATEVVWPENGAGFYYILLSGPTIGTKRFAALSDAKSAAQADYEQRIRSALVDVPAVESVGDDLIGYVLRYGGMCRDCADMDGVCQSGQPCDTEQRRAVIKHTTALAATRSGSATTANGQSDA